MKKLFYLLSLALCLTLLLCMTGCGEKDPAEELWAEVNSEMNRLQSFKSDTTAKITVFASNQAITTTVKGYTIVIDGEGEELYYCNVADGVVKTSANDTEITTSSLELYENGEVFIKNYGPDAEQKIRSVISKADYLALYEKRITHGFNQMECQNRILTENEDGSRVITCSGYSEKSVENYLDTLGFDPKEFGEKVLDLKLTITVDTSNRIKESKMELVFDTVQWDKQIPEGVVKTVYSEYNSAEENNPFISKRSFSKIDNIALLYDIENMFKALDSKTEGSFEYDIRQGIDIMGSHKGYSEKDVVTFYEKDGDFFYNIEATVDDSKNINISYKYGNQTVTSEQQDTQKNKQTEDEARAYINALMNNVNFETRYINSIKDLGDGKYELNFATSDSTSYKQALATLGASYNGIKQTATITIKDGKIIATENYVFVSGTIRKNNNSYIASITLNTTTTFGE